MVIVMVVLIGFEHEGRDPKGDAWHRGKTGSRSPLAPLPVLQQARMLVAGLVGWLID